MSFESAQAAYDSAVPSDYWWEAYPCAQTGVSCEDCEVHEDECPFPDDDWSGAIPEDEWTLSNGEPWLTEDEDEEPYEAVEDFDKAGDR